MKTLHDNQITHVERLLKIINKYSFAIDTSKTGAGKTVTSIDTYRKLSALESSHLIVLCPPTLIPNWEKHLKEEILDSSLVSVSSIFALMQRKWRMSVASLCRGDRNVFLILDECHLFKNGSTKRYRFLSNLLGQVDNFLMLSATPIDNERQYISLLRLLNLPCNIAVDVFANTHTSFMRIDYKHRCSVNLYHVTGMSNEEKKKYGRGSSLIAHSSNSLQEDGFNPRMFQAGIYKIHDSLLRSLLIYASDILRRQAYKVILVLMYKDHFAELKRLAPRALILNGDTPMKDRVKIVSCFQESNFKYPLLAMSINVGGVGMELDDKYGTFPRHIITLPTTNGTDFMQMIGRVLRFNTQSNSIVSVIQPDRNSTYFARQMVRKMSVVKNFADIPNFKHAIDKHHDTCVISLYRKYFCNLFGSDVYSVILEFGCECLNYTDINKII